LEATVYDKKESVSLGCHRRRHLQDTEGRAVMVPVITKSLRQVKRIIVLAVGFTILFLGIALLVLPGPAFIVIPLGLGILATELLWARRLLKIIKKPFQRKKETTHAR